MISFEELIEKHKFNKNIVLETVKRLKSTDHLFLYQNCMMDSSGFGRQHLLIVGPGRTSSDPENPPKEIDPFNCGGLPSKREQLIGEVDLVDVRGNRKQVKDE